MTCPDIKTPIRTFSPSGKCEQCAVREFKEKHPLTWNLGWPHGHLFNVDTP